jgi:hypothetical protein
VSPASTPRQSSGLVGLWAGPKKLACKKSGMSPARPDCRACNFVSNLARMSKKPGLNQLKRPKLKAQTQAEVQVRPRPDHAKTSKDLKPEPNPTFGPKYKAQTRDFRTRLPGPGCPCPVVPASTKCDRREHCLHCTHSIMKITASDVLLLFQRPCFTIKSFKS